jgi:hypothetical protein
MNLGMSASNKAVTQNVKKGNPAWVKGAKSPNPKGRGIKKKPDSTRVTNIMIKFALKRGSLKELEAIYDKLKPEGKLSMHKEVWDKIIPKQNNLTVDTPYDKASDEALNAHYNRLKELAKQLTVFQGPIQSQPGQVLFLKSSTAENNGTDQG